MQPELSWITVSQVCCLVLTSMCMAPLMQCNIAPARSEDMYEILLKRGIGETGKWEIMRNINKS